MLPASSCFLTSYGRHSTRHHQKLYWNYQLNRSFSFWIRWWEGQTVLEARSSESGEQRACHRQHRFFLLLNNCWPWPSGLRYSFHLNSLHLVYSSFERPLLTARLYWNCDRRLSRRKAGLSCYYSFKTSRTLYLQTLARIPRSNGCLEDQKLFPDDCLDSCIQNFIPWDYLDWVHWLADSMSDLVFIQLASEYPLKVSHLELPYPFLLNCSLKPLSHFTGSWSPWAGSRIHYLKSPLQSLQYTLI